MSSSVDIESQQLIVLKQQESKSNHLLKILLMIAISTIVIILITHNINNNHHQAFSYRNLLSGSFHDNEIIINSLKNPFEKLGFDYSIIIYLWLINLNIQSYYNVHDMKKYQTYSNAFEDLLETFPSQNLWINQSLPQINPFKGYVDIGGFNGTYRHHIFQRYNGTSSEHIGSVLYVNQQTKHVIISFLGTKSWMDIYTDLKMTQGFFTSDDTADFHAEIYNIANNQIQQIDQYLRDNGHIDGLWSSDFELITMTGCSLGGALAAMSGYFLHSKQDVEYKKLEIVTFGQPQILRDRRQNKYNWFIGNDYQPKWLDFESVVNNATNDKINFIRIRHENDPIPKYPGIFGFFHIGKEVNLTEDNQHPTGCKGFRCHKPSNTYIPMIYHDYFKGGVDGIKKKLNINTNDKEILEF